MRIANGEPKAADFPQPMTCARDERGWKVSFDGDEHFEVPESLVSGGRPHRSPSSGVADLRDACRRVAARRSASPGVREYAPPRLPPRAPAD